MLWVLIYSVSVMRSRSESHGRVHVAQQTRNRNMAYFAFILIVAVLCYTLLFHNSISSDHYDLVERKHLNNDIFSSVECKGSRDADDWRSRVCLLRNVCYGQGKFHYFSKDPTKLVFKLNEEESKDRIDEASYVLDVREVPRREETWAEYIHRYYFHRPPLVSSSVKARPLYLEEKVEAVPRSALWAKGDYFYGAVEDKEVTTMMSWLRAKKLFRGELKVNFITDAACKHCEKLKKMIPQKRDYILHQFRNTCFEKIIVGSGATLSGSK